MTPTEIEKHASRLLKPTERLVASRVHPNAVEYTGQALFEALQAYDPSRGTIEAWVGFKVPAIVRDILRSELGREGSSRSDIRQKTSHIGDRDFSSRQEGSEFENTEEETRILRMISESPREAKKFLAARFVADPPLRNCDLSRILNIAPNNLRNQATRIPQLLRGV